MDESNIIKSIYNVNLESKVIVNNSHILAVILPGIGYTLDRPLLDYSKKLCIELGYNVLPIEYGFQAARTKFDGEKFNYLLDETMKLLKISLSSKYKKIIFIGKSIGTVVQNVLQQKLLEEEAAYEFRNIYLTPVDKTVELGIVEDSIVFSGTCDPLIRKDSIDKIESIDNVKLIKIIGGDHSLNIKNNAIKSMEFLIDVIKSEKDYLIKTIGNFNKI